MWLQVLQSLSRTAVSTLVSGTAPDPESVSAQLILQDAPWNKHKFTVVVPGLQWGGSKSGNNITEDPSI
jgi:hypothetical protein